MLRTCFRCLTLPIWAVWLLFAAMERPMSVACQMIGVGSAASASHTMAGGAGMQHGSHHAPSREAVPNCCGCLGDCSAAPLAILPGGGAIDAVHHAAIVRQVAGLPNHHAPATCTDLLLPYPNGPPHFALIA